MREEKIEWIDRKVHAPPIGKSVLCWVSDTPTRGFMDIGHRILTNEFGQMFHIPVRGATYNVTHWMPLPEPPTK